MEFAYPQSSVLYLYSQRPSSPLHPVYRWGHWDCHWSSDLSKAPSLACSRVTNKARSHKSWSQAHLFGWLGVCLKSDIPDSLLFKSNGDVSLYTAHFVTIVCYPFCISAATQWEERAEGSSVHCLQTDGNPCVCFSNCQPMGGLDPVLGRDKEAFSCLFSG